MFRALRKFQLLPVRKNSIQHSLIGIGQPYLEYNVLLDENKIISLIKLIQHIHDPNQDNSDVKNLIFDTMIRESSQFPFRESATILPGGSVLNALRITEWLTHNESKTTFMGSCGNDYESEILKDLLEMSNVNHILSIRNNEPTAKSLNMILDQNPASYSQIVQLIDIPGASKNFSFDKKIHTESRIAFNSAKSILASFLPYPLENSNNKAIIEISDLACSSNKLFALKLPFCNGLPIDNYLTAKEWLHLLMNVDILFLDLNSALKIAKIFANWKVAVGTKPESIRPDVKLRFEEFNDSLKLDENAIYSMSLSLAATMPGLAERLAISLAHLPKRQAKQSRIVFLLGSGTSTGGIVACTNQGKLKRLSDLKDRSNSFNLNPSQSKFNEIGLNGVDKTTDAFVGGIMAKVLEGDVNSDKFIVESMFVGFKVAQFISKNQNGLFPKILPDNLSDILNDKF